MFKHDFNYLIISSLNLNKLIFMTFKSVKVAQVAHLALVPLHN